MIFTIFSLIFLLSVFYSMSYSATVVWSEDFEGDLSNWTTLGVVDNYNWTAGNVTIADGVLWSQGDEFSNETNWELSLMCAILQ